MTDIKDSEKADEPMDQTAAAAAAADEDVKKPEDPDQGGEGKEADEEPPEKRAKVEEEEEEAVKKKSPELLKLWKTVEDDPADFNGWTYLLQHVDGGDNVDHGREAYDAFLHR